VSDTPSDEQLSEAVLAYLSECPNAEDTAAGVTDWWLMRQRVRDQVESVTRVLTDLVARGVLVETGTGDERRYRLNAR
jgi:hypothetical protein